MKNEFMTKYDSEGNLLELINVSDKFHMNWVRPGMFWGKVIAPEGICVEKNHFLTEKNTFVESYCFQNTSAFPVYFKETDLAIGISLPDNYTSAEECMKYHCNTHLWCGKASSWIQAYRMGGAAPHLGMVLREGSLRSYSIRREEADSSNDRGSFLLHPELVNLFPGETCTISFEWFWFEDDADFEEKRLNLSDFPMVHLKKSTYFVGEKAEFTIYGNGSAENISVKCKNGCEVRLHKIAELEENTSGEWKNGYQFSVEFDMNVLGEYELEICVNGKETKVLLYGCEPLERLVEKRCHFIAEKQQETKGLLSGAYLIFDKESGRRYYSHLHDHNGGRERMAMGALLASWLQEHSDKDLEESLEAYLTYIYREIFDTETGDTCNDISHNLEWDRLYNYPWLAILLLEVYEWKKDVSYLKDAYRTLIRFYEKGGDRFYPIGLPAVELLDKLEKESMKEEAEKFKCRLIRHGEFICETGLSFPKSEVNYEQSIAAPAVDILLQVYEVTGRKEFFDMAEKILAVLLLFNGHQPDYHLFENAIRHWDGFWFGKKRLLGDTFPHYWSMLTGVVLAKYGKIKIRSGKEQKCNEDLQVSLASLERAENSLRGCLNLFDKEGFGSCAFVYPESVNEKQAHYYDPWANDQDWALYYAWKNRF